MMEMQELLGDISPEELEPRLELQILTDPLSFAVQPQDNNNINCSVKGACNIQVPQ